MKIGIDSSFLYSNIGFGTYSCNLIKELANIDRENEYYLICNELPRRLPVYEHIDATKEKERIPLPPNFKEVTTNSKIRLYWSRYQLPKILEREGIQVFHSVDNITGRFTKQPFTFVLTVHDIIPILYPEFVTRADKLVYKYVYPNVLQSADRIIVDSNNTKTDILKNYRIKEEKVKVVYLGCDTGKFKPIKESDKINEVCSRYGIKGKYLLSVSILAHRRNIYRLLKAFHLLRSKHSEFRQQKLVIVGNFETDANNILKYTKENELSKHVIFTGYVPDEDLPYLYNGAKLFVYPSLYEGFGLTVLEAMSCGVPVVTSNISSIPEITGDAAQLVDPYSVDDIYMKMHCTLESESKQDDMRTLGLERAKLFSWRKTAQQTREIYESFL